MSNVTSPALSATFAMSAYLGVDWSMTLSKKKKSATIEQEHDQAPNLKPASFFLRLYEDTAGMFTATSITFKSSTML